MKQTLLFITLIVSIRVSSQNDIEIFKRLVTKDSSSIPNLFSYPDSIRNAILIASTYPQGFVRLDEIQKMTSLAFKKLISTYKQSKQKQLWEITRYPGLTSLLIENRGKSKSEFDDILKNYPDKIKSTAFYFIKNDHSTLVEMDKIRQDFEAKYSDLIRDFPDDVKKSFKILVRHPEVVTLLTEDMKTTVTLGDLYKRNPVSLKHKTDSLYFEVTKANGLEYEEWKQGINKDTAVQKELKQISKKYAEDQDAEDDVYSNETAPDKSTIAYEVNPYPYWAGYPYWYGRNYWYPYPWWYQSGFYWQLNGPIVFFGMPHYHFGWWYYNHPRYYNHYQHTSDYFHRHYEGHRNSNAGFNKSVGGSHYGRRK